MLPITLFRNYIQEQNLFTQSQRILLAVSGGKDSVLMVHLFKGIGMDVAIAHCNFNLRKGEAERDEAFVRQLAKQLDIPFYGKHFQTEQFASQHKISTQMAARDLRYQWFEELRSEHSFDYIALAQHQNDVVETVLINITRGTGISGLHGIFPKRGNLIRPLLFLKREDIEDIVAKNKIDFVEDSSNASTKYTRNKLRHQVVPVLKQINPNLEQTFVENAKRFNEIEIFLHDQVEELKKKMWLEKTDGIYIELAKIKELRSPNLILFEMLKPFLFPENVIADILKAINGQSGKTFFSPTHQLTLDRAYLIVQEITIQSSPDVFIDGRINTIQFNELSISIAESDLLTFDSNLNKAYVDADLLVYPLQIRTWQEGDKFMPIGMKGYKKLSDFFIDEKVPVSHKNNLAILVNGNNQIIWIIGLRSDNRYKITKSTKKVTIFESKLTHGK